MCLLFELQDIFTNKKAKNNVSTYNHLNWKFEWKQTIDWYEILHFPKSTH